jgi:hypothetical protein
MLVRLGLSPVSVLARLIVDSSVLWNSLTAGLLSRCGDRGESRSGK